MTTLRRTIKQRPRLLLLNEILIFKREHPHMACFRQQFKFLLNFEKEITIIYILPQFQQLTFLSGQIV